VQLVLQAAALTTGGEVFMLEMGEPVRIVDLALNMIRLSGRRVGEDIELRITGVRPGEKLEEELHGPEEDVESTTHPSVLRLHPRPMPAGDLARGVRALTTLASTGFDSHVRQGLFALARRETWLQDEPIVIPDRRHHRRDWVVDLTSEGAVWTPSTT
jgi:FlaA1/EpsC-like NDP-sugar epimerase